METVQEEYTHERHLDKADIQSFERPKEIRNFPKGHLELIQVGGHVIGRTTLEPGWKWSESIQPIAKTKSCEASHFQYHLSGVLMVKMDNGDTYQCRKGDVSMLPPGHDAWVVGDEPVVVVDFQGMIDYAKNP
jgi:hypothetical protein